MGDGQYIRALLPCFVEGDFDRKGAIDRFGRIVSGNLRKDASPLEVMRMLVTLEEMAEKANG